MTHQRSQLPTMTARKAGTALSCLRSQLAARRGSWMTSVGICGPSAGLNRNQYTFM